MPAHQVTCSDIFSVMIQDGVTIQLHFNTICILQILRHVGEFSTECQLQPGEPLDKPFDAIDEQTGSLEEEVRSRAAMHEQEELITRSDQKTDFR